jgi:hypothetical protein
MSKQEDKQSERVLPEGLMTDLEKAFQAIKAYNGGYGVVTIQLKGLLVPVIDIQMRQFRKDEQKKIS